MPVINRNSVQGLEFGETSFIGANKYQLSDADLADTVKAAATEGAQACMHSEADGHACVVIAAPFTLSALWFAHDKSHKWRTVAGLGPQVRTHV